MNALIKKLAIGAVTLALATAPLAASAQDWHHDHGGRGPGYRGRVVYHAGWDNHPYPGHPWGHPYAQRWHEGYYGWAPAGFNGYYHNGGWYHHRRWSGGIWIYF